MDKKDNYLDMKKDISKRKRDQLIKDYGSDDEKG